MKKLLSMMLALVMVFAVIACTPKAPETPEEVTGETYDTGEFTALVPEGWMAFPSSDMWDEYEGDYDPTGLQICKDAKSEWDLFSKPCITINYYEDATEFVSAKSWYDDAQDITPFDLGNYSWTGYTATSLDLPYTILEGTDGVSVMQVSILTENSGNSIALEDADVQAIIMSILAN